MALAQLNAAMAEADAPMVAARRAHWAGLPDGYASRANEIGVTFDPPPDYAGIAAAAGGAFARSVHRADEVAEALDQALAAAKQEKRAAVLDVWLPHL